MQICMWLLIALKQMSMEKDNIFWLNDAVIKFSLYVLVIFVWKIDIVDQMLASHFILSRGQSNRPLQVQMVWIYSFIYRGLFPKIWCRVQDCILIYHGPIQSSSVSSAWIESNCAILNDETMAKKLKMHNEEVFLEILS